jgi:acetolactate synthase small subunit
MKKILIGLLLIIAFLLTSVYLFIPGRSQIEATTTINAASPGVFRALSDNASWKTFWPGNTPFKLDDKTYAIKERSYNVLSIDVSSADNTLTSTINLLPIRSDLLTIEWAAVQLNSSNPFKRLSQYRQASALEKELNMILGRIKEFMEQTKNVYGIDIKQTKVADSVLITTRRSFDHQPSSKDVDDMIQNLRRYITENNAVEKNFPMLNIFSSDSSHYQGMTAIAVDRELPLTKEFVPKFLLKGGNILEVEIRGGPYTIENAFKELENYRSDYKYASPAIPYQLLVTDRLKEVDTAKWITKLYYPIY